MTEERDADTPTDAQSIVAGDDDSDPPVAPAESSQPSEKPKPSARPPVEAKPSPAEKMNESHGPVTTTNGRKRPPYKYDPEKVTLRFLFANRDGLAVTIECKPEDTVGEVKGALLSVWPDELPNCSGGDRLRLICMGKGILMPDTRSLEDCQVPVFKTHPTPINVSVKPENISADTNKAKHGNTGSSNNRDGGNNAAAAAATTQGCSCAIL